MAIRGLQIDGWIAAVGALREGFPLRSALQVMLGRLPSPVLFLFDVPTWLWPSVPSSG